MNKMKDVAAILGVQLNEEFEIEYPGHPEYQGDNLFILREDGLYARNKNYQAIKKVDQQWLTDLITGEIKIIHPPFKPKYEEDYWTITSDRDGVYIDITTWTNHGQDYKNYALGLCFRTQEEAEANKDKLLEIIEHYKETSINQRNGE